MNIKIKIKTNMKIKNWNGNDNEYIKKKLKCYYKTGNDNVYK